MIAAAGLLLAWGVNGAPAQAESSEARQGPRESLVAASSGTHLWFAVPKDGGCRILHHAASMPDGAVREAGRLPAVPQAMAASGDQLWVVMPTEGSPRSNPVYSVTTHRNPATGLAYETPTGRFDVLPSLPSGVGSPSIVADGAALLALASPSAIECHRLGVDRWTTVPFPQGWLGPSVLGVWWHEGARCLGVSAPRDGNLSALCRVASKIELAPWTTLGFAGAGEGFEFWVSGANCNAFLRSRPGGVHELCVAQAAGVRVVARLAAPSQAWTVLGLGDGFMLAVEASRGEVSMAEIDPITGVVAAPSASVAIVPQTFEWVHLPLLGAATIALLLIGFVMKPTLESSRRLARGWEPLSMVRRTVALAIDLLPGAGVALAITGEGVTALMVMPSWTAQLSECASAAVMMAFTALWCGAFELVWRASPGKFLVGGRVIASEPRSATHEGDARAGTGRVLARAAIKGVVLMAPALGILAFVHPLHMGVSETISGTALARRTTPMSG